LIRKINADVDALQILKERDL